MHPQLGLLRKAQGDHSGELHDDAESERLERRGVERAGGCEIGDSQADVVEDMGWILGGHATTLPG